MSSSYPFKFLFQPGGKLEISRGLRSIFAFAVPMIIGKFTPYSDIAVYVGLAALFFILGDVGGLYKTRATTLKATILSCSLSLFIGTLVANVLWLKILTTGLWLFAAGYATVLGHPGTMTGIVTGLFFLFAIELPGGDWFLGVQRVSVCLLGGGWAMFLSLVMWPILPFLPLRKAVAGCYQAIASYIQDSRTHPTAELERVLKLKQALQTARETLTIHRRERMGGSPMGELLIILIEDADRLITSVVSLIELVEVYHDSPQFLTVSILIDDALRQIALTSKNLAKLILNQTATVDLGSLKLICQAIAQQKQLQRETIKDNLENYPSLIAVDRLLVILELIIKQLEATGKTASLMESLPRKVKKNGNGNVVNKENNLNKLESEKTAWFEPLEDNFTLDSSLFRHGIRLGITTAIAVTIYSLANISQGFWVTLTILLVLQPDIGQTFQRFFHRIIGTIFGAIFTSILLTIINSKAILEIISVFSISIAFSLIRFHYGIAVFFISIFAMISSELNDQVSDWHIALIRISCTLLGAALAVLAVFLLFRDREKKRIPNYLVALIEATASYFKAVMQVYLGEVEYNQIIITQERQKNRLAYFNAQASFQRFSSDPQTKTVDIEPVLTLINYLNRFSLSVTVLLAQLEHFSGSEPMTELTRFVAQVEQNLAELADSILNHTPPPSLEDLEVSEENIQARLHDLQAVRLEEFAANLENTPTRQVLRDFSILGVEIEAMNDQLAAINSAVMRIVNS